MVLPPLPQFYQCLNIKKVFPGNCLIFHTLYLAKSFSYHSPSHEYRVTSIRAIEMTMQRKMGEPSSITYRASAISVRIVPLPHFVRRGTKKQPQTVFGIRKRGK